MDPDRSSLQSLIAAETGQPVSAAADALIETILRRHERAVAAVLFYGSCLRGADPRTGDEPVFDFYVLVDTYRHLYGGRFSACANALLPPNVFYLEQIWAGRTLRAKYAVMSLAQFRRAVSRRAFICYFWARFAQPVRLAYARDDAVRTSVCEALADAIITLVDRTVGLMNATFTPSELWTRGFQETYRAELRAEPGGQASRIYHADRERYDRLTHHALGAAGLQEPPAPDGRFSVVLPGWSRQVTLNAWQVRRVFGKSLAVLRLAKGTFTFVGGVDYILWKIERHTGVKTVATPWQRRHPLLAAPGLAWRVYRRGGFR